MESDKRYICYHSRVATFKIFARCCGTWVCWQNGICRAQEPESSELRHKVLRGADSQVIICYDYDHSPSPPTQRWGCHRSDRAVLWLKKLTFQ